MEDAESDGHHLYIFRGITISIMSGLTGGAFPCSHTEIPDLRMDDPAQMTGLARWHEGRNFLDLRRNLNALCLSMDEPASLFECLYPQL